MNWIREWLTGRRGVIEVQGERSKWFSIEPDGPQGSSCTQTLFIAYHSDVFLLRGRLSDSARRANRYCFTDQCLILEHKLKNFLNQLGYYSKTKAMFSA